LPCRCGQQVVVEPRQAGQTVACSCGQSLPIPTMLEMAALEPAPDERPVLPPGDVWGWRRAMMFLGEALILISLVLGIVFQRNRPIAMIDTIDPDSFRQGAKNFSPSLTWHIWRDMKRGLDRRMLPADRKYADDMMFHRVKQGFAVILALGGIVLVGASMAMKRRQGEGETERRGEGEPKNG
jgi:hypothetical protein